jgi:glycosyltransferase involved in cell wall biosynthesis
MQIFRVLHAIDDLPNHGNGMVNCALDIAAGQQDSGHVVAFAAGGGEYTSLLRDRKIAHFCIARDRSPLGLLRGTWLFWAAVRGFRADIIHVHSKVALLFAWVSRPLHRLPIIAHLHNVHDRGSRFMKLADRVIAVSDSVRRSMQDEGVPAEKVSVVLNGTIGSPRLRFAVQGKIADLRQPAIVSVGQLGWRKGISELMAAFAKVATVFPAAQLYLVGDGPERSLFEAEAQALPCHDSIHFEGFQSSPQDYMRAAKIFVLASRRDSCPLVLTEAREIGIAIVATSVDGIPELLDGGTAGLLVPPQNPEALAVALTSLLEDASLREIWRQRSTQNLSHFTITRMAREVIEVYTDVLQCRYATVTSRSKLKTENVH